MRFQRQRMCHYVTAKDKVLGYFSVVNKHYSGVCDEIR